MARKTARIQIISEGRDKGKVFIITEADPYTTEDFAARVIVAAMNAGASIPENVASMGLPGLMQLGFKGLALIPYAELKPLMVEMMQCVAYQPDASKADYTRAVGFDGDIEELATLVTLRKAIVGLHTDFFTVASPSSSATPPPAVATS